MGFLDDIFADADAIKSRRQNDPFEDIWADADEAKRRREESARQMAEHALGLGKDLADAGAAGGLNPGFVEVNGLAKSRAFEDEKDPGLLHRLPADLRAGLADVDAAVAGAGDFALTRLDESPIFPGYWANKIVDPFLSDEQRRKLAESEAKSDELLAGPLRAMKAEAKDAASMLRPAHQNMLDKVAEGLPTTGAIIGSSLLAGPLAGPAATQTFGGAASAVLGSLMGADDAATEMESRGVSRDTASALGSLVGAGIAPFEYIGNTRLAKALTGGLPEERFLPGMVKTILNEGVTEGAQELPPVMGEYLTGKYDDRKATDVYKEVLGRVSENAAIGGLTGGLLHGAGHTFTQVRQVAGLGQEAQGIGKLFDDAFDSAFSDLKPGELGEMDSAQGRSRALGLKDFGPVQPKFDPNSDDLVEIDFSKDKAADQALAETRAKVEAQVPPGVLAPEVTGVPPVEASHQSEVPRQVAEGALRVRRLAMLPPEEQALAGVSPREVSIAKKVVLGEVVPVPPEVAAKKLKKGQLPPQPTVKFPTELNPGQTRAVARVAFGASATQATLFETLGQRIPEGRKRKLAVPPSQGGAVAAVGQVIARAKAVMDSFQRESLTDVAKNMLGGDDRRVIERAVGAPIEAWTDEHSAKFTELVNQAAAGAVPGTLQLARSSKRLIDRMHNAYRAIQDAEAAGVLPPGSMPQGMSQLFGRLASQKAAQATGNQSVAAAAAQPAAPAGPQAGPGPVSPVQGAAPATPAPAGAPVMAPGLVNPLDAVMHTGWDPTDGSQRVKTWKEQGQELWNRWVDRESAIMKMARSLKNEHLRDLIVSVRNAHGIAQSVLQNFTTRWDAATNSRVQTGESLASIIADRSREYLKDLSRMLAGQKQIEIESVLYDHQVELFNAEAAHKLLTNPKDKATSWDRQTQLKERIKELQDGLDPKNTVIARDGLRELTSRLGPQAVSEMQQTAKRVRDFAVRAMLDPLVEVGRLSMEERNNILAQNQMWAPFARRWYKEVVNELNTTGDALKFRKRGNDIGGKTFENALGFIEPEGILDPLEVIANRAQQITIWVEKQRVRNAVLSLNDQHADVFTDMVRLDPFTGRPVKGQGVKFVREKGMDTLSRWEDGKRIDYAVSGDVYRGLGRLDPGQVGMVREIMQRVAHGLRVGATLVPKFIARNPARDQWTAAALSRHGYIPIKDFVTGILATMPKEIMGNSQWWQQQQQLIQILEANGSELGSYVGASSPYAAASALEDLRSRNSSTQFWSDIKKSWRENVLHPVEGRSRARGAVSAILDTAIAPFEAAAKISERGTRVGAGLKAMKRKGVTPLQAVREMREQVGVDFDAGGDKGRKFNSITAFWNVSVQDSTRVARAFRQNPAGTTLKMFTFLTIPAMANLFAHWDDDNYDKLADYDRRMFMHFPENKDGSYSRVPRPLGLANSMFGYGAELIVGGLLKQFKGTPEEGLVKEWGMQAFAGVNPGVLPTALSLGVDAYRNKDSFRTRPIDDMGEMSSSMELRGQDQGPTIQMASKIVQPPLAALGALSGQEDIADLGSPNRVAFMAEGLGAGMAKAILGASDALIFGEGTTMQQPSSLGDFLGYVSKKPTGFRSSQMQDFRKMKAAADMQIRDKNVLSKANNQDALVKHLAKMYPQDYYDTLNQTERDLDRLRAEQQAIVRDYRPGRERAEKLAAINDMIDLILASTQVWAKEFKPGKGSPANLERPAEMGTEE